MGIIRMGPPEDLVLLLRDSDNIKQFIETGTFKGSTAAWASKHFESVITIENSEKYFKISNNFLSKFSNIKVIKGDSRKILPQLLRKNREKTIFWLDAHFCCDAFGQSDECPLLEEIAQIVKYSPNSVLLIDDARLFLSPPPKPHNPDQWPNILEILLLLENNNHYSIIIEDVIISVPNITKQILITGVQDYLSKDVKNKFDIKLSLIVRLKKLLHRVIFRERK